MVKNISGTLQIEAKVTNIAMTAKGVRVYWNQLERHQNAEFDAVICTVPATALTQINFDTDISDS